MNIKDAKDAIKKTLNIFLEDLLHVKKEDHNVSIKSRWGSWTVIQRVTWVFMVEARCGLEEIKAYNKKFDDWFQKLKDENQDKHWDELHEVDGYGEYELAKESEWKYWYETNPKNIMLCDFVIRPTQAVEFITTKITLDNIRQE